MISNSIHSSKRVNKFGSFYLDFTIEKPPLTPHPSNTPFCIVSVKPKKRQSACTRINSLFYNRPILALIRSDTFQPALLLEFIYLLFYSTRWQVQHLGNLASTDFRVRGYNLQNFLRTFLRIYPGRFTGLFTGPEGRRRLNIFTFERGDKMGAKF